jgi:hypothetical protein
MVRTLKTTPEANRQVSIETPYTDAEALELLGKLIKENKFAGSLYAQRRLSPNQWVWVHKLVCDAFLATPKTPATKPEAAPVNLANVLAIFKNGLEHKARPRIAFNTTDERGLRLYYSPPNARRIDPRIYVTDGSRSDKPQSYYGYVDMSGMYHPSFYATPEVMKFLTTLDKWPSAVTGFYGRLTKRCIYCRIQLTDERSLAVGYGPVCAENHGLPWGEVPELPKGVEDEMRKYLADSYVTATDDDD